MQIQKKICVVGLGSIGLPTACLLAESGYDVLGVDVDETVISSIESKSLKNSEPGLQNLLIKVKQSGRLQVSKNPSVTDIFILVVPTKLNADKQPDLSRLYAAVDNIKPYLADEALVLIESTCPIGTTEMIAKMLKQDLPKIRLAYCPERVLPGNILHELINNDRIVGGIDNESTAEAREFYESFVKGKVFTTDTRTAEAVKLAENTYRDINLAYANELSLIADQSDLNVYEVIRLANRHPRVDILNPGPGVGGYCLTVNPWFLAASAPEVAILTSKAREINEKKSEWVIDKIKKAIRDCGIKVVTFLGMTYKADVSDLRESVAMSIIKSIKNDVEVLLVDPYIPDSDPMDESIQRAGLVIGLVAHKEFFKINPRDLEGKMLLDYAGIFQ